MSSKEKTALVPRLRFLEFLNDGEWKISTLDSLAVKITNKNKDCSITRILTNSAVDGVVDQSEYFEREIVTQSNIGNYFVIDEGDYVYNPRISTSAPVGPISKNKIGKGVMSPLYTVFRFNDSQNEFYEQYFKTNLWNSYLKNVSNTGARYDRISISTENFMKMPLPYSSDKEQQKIAECLSSIDDLVSAEDKKLAALKDHKKGLMRKLFPTEGKTLPEWRFPEFRGSGEWEISKLGAVCNVLQGYGFPTAMQGKQHGKYPFCKVSDISVAVINSGGILSRAVNYVNEIELASLHAKPIAKGTTVFAKIGEALRLNRRAITSVECLIDNNAVGIKAKDDSFDDYFIYLSSQLIDLGKHCGGSVPSVNKTTIEKIELSIPPTLLEQQKVANCLSSLDDIITAQAEKIEALKAHKKGLMQGLFPSIEEVRD